MNKIKAKILKKKTEVEEEGVIVLHQLTKLSFLPKFWLLDVQAVFLRLHYKRLFSR